MSGQSAYNQLKVSRKEHVRGWWSTRYRTVTFVIERRDGYGLQERRQVTFRECEVLRALRVAGYTVLTPEDRS